MVFLHTLSLLLQVHLPVFPPSTQVYYHVGDAMGGWSPVYSVKTAPTAGTLVHPDKPIVFATFGDMGTVQAGIQTKRR